MRSILKDSTDQSVIVRIVDSGDGTPEQAVEHNTAGVSLWYRREGGVVVAITPAALAAADTAHTDGGIEHLDDGYYRLDLPDAAGATGANGVMIGGAFTGMVVIGCYVPLVDAIAGNTIQLNGSATAAARLAALYAAVPTGTVQASPAPTTTVFDSQLAQTSDDWWNNAVLMFTSGDNIGVCRRVADYDGTSTIGKITLNAATPATPVDGDTFLILGRIE